MLCLPYAGFFFYFYVSVKRIEMSSQRRMDIEGIIRETFMHWNGPPVHLSENWVLTPWAGCKGRAICQWKETFEKLPGDGTKTYNIQHTYGLCNSLTESAMGPIH